VAAVGIGAHPDLAAAIRAMTRVTERIDPRPEVADVYDRLYVAYLALYPATARLLRPLNVEAGDRVGSGT
jgi:ribulose kinase